MPTSSAKASISASLTFRAASWRRPAVMACVRSRE
jgi:hypothetical protein